MKLSSICSIRDLSLVACVLALLSGCAGGLRNGATSSAGSAAATPAAPSGTGAAPAAVAPAADEVVFVWKGEGNSVAVAGEFNAWNTSADMLVKQADGSWKLAKKLPPGRHAYKFVIDGGTWKEDPNAKETVDDGYGGKNAVVVVGAAGGPSKSSDAGMAATLTVPAGKGKAPVIGADGVTFTFAGAASSVNLAGEFNSWSTTSDPMVKQADGTWTITKKLPAGTYSYKFVIDGSTWKSDESNPEGKDDGFGGKNSVLVVP